MKTNDIKIVINANHAGEQLRKAMARLANLNCMNKQNSYEFKIQNPAMMDWTEVARELSRENPILYVTIGNEKYVVVKDFITIKSRLVNIPFPVYANLYFTSGDFVVYSLIEPDNSNGKFELSFDAWRRWVVRVLKASWGEAKDNKIVKVEIPTIKVK